MRKLSLFFLFGFCVSSMSSAQQPQTNAERLDLSKRIEVRHASGRVTLKACTQKKCNPIGNPQGYTRDELKKKFDVEHSNHVGGVVGQIIFDGVQYESSIVAAFVDPVQWEGQTLVSARCPLTTAMAKHIEAVSEGAANVAYVFNLGDHRKSDCAGNRNEDPGNLDVLVSRLNAALK